ncbi:MAG: asparagine synthase (glutamine-hydrolyzing) [Acidobacteriota bacterium]
MCGFCGELRLGGAGVVQPERLTAMRDTLVHRGPDTAGLFLSSDGRVGLGFRRLSILDLTPNANQPMPNEDGSIQVVFNGEIYNYRNLRRDIEGRHRFRSHSDSEVIVHLYEEKGVDAIADLDGMFAIAIWDGRLRRLVLARDRAGKKPLFYLVCRDCILFASEIKAFFQHPEARIEPDPSAFPAYLLYGCVPGPRTLYRDVKHVEPASTLTIAESGDIRQHTYWRLRYRSKAELAASRGPGRAKAAARVRELVEQAVARRLISDVPIGAFLSGGIDSSIVVGVMSRQMSAPVRTFSIGFDGDPAYDETAHARTVAERFKTDHTEFRVTPSAVGLVEKLVWHHDGPFGDASAIPTYIVSQLTRQHVTVALNGDGGDELFAGYVRFGAALAAERIPRVARRLLSLSLSRLPSPANGRHLLARAQRFARAMDLPLHERMTRWITLFYDDVEALFEPKCLALLEPIDRLAHLRPEMTDLAPLSTLGQLLHVNYRTYLRDDLLVKMDRSSMANSLETRSPFLDRELTEYVAQLPDELKLSGMQRKVVLREAFADLLPTSIKKRGKMGFGIPLDTWFRGELRGYVRETLLASNARYSSYLSRQRVEALVRDHEERRANLGLQLWTLLTFEVWLRLLSEWTRQSWRPTHMVTS